MFGDINDVRIMGNITRDPELRTISSGTSVCNFGVATNRRYQQNNEWKEEVEFHNVVIWGQRAESFTQRARKGTRVYIEGRLQTRNWEDQNGVKQFKTEIVVNRFILIDRYERVESSFNQDSGPAGISAKKSKPPIIRKGKDDKEDKKDKDVKPKGNENNDESIDPDDLPF